MRPAERCRPRGAALVIVVVALALLGAVVTGAFCVALFEVRAADRTAAARQAFDAAEAAMASVLAGWDRDAFDDLPSGAPNALLPTTSGRVRVLPTVTRLTERLFLITALAERLDGNGGVLARQVLGTIARPTPTPVDVQAALTSTGSATVGSQATVDGADHVPEGWAGCPPDASMAGVRAGGDVTVAPTGALRGNPPGRARDSTAVDSILRAPFNALKALRSVTIPGDVADGMTPAATGAPSRCDAGIALNWGEPWRGPPVTGAISECQGYFPVLYRNGNLTVQGGRGQGVLLVEGSLEIRGDFEFTGLVMSLGGVLVTGRGTVLTGAVIAPSVEVGDPADPADAPAVRYSSCAVARALMASAVVRPVLERSWVQLYR